MDPEAELSIRERLSDDDPRDWGNTIPFLAEAVPGDVDEYRRMIDAGVDRDLAAAMMDASFMTFAEWRTHHAAI